MKSKKSFAATLLCLFVFASAGFAATYPLNSPQGMAVDSKGNMYVANSGSNQILVYTPAYAQVKAKTITANVSSPTGVAIDPTGNIWVANLVGPSGTGNVTEYGPTGVQDTTRTITDGIKYPDAIATDGIGDIWVGNNYSVVTVYPAFGGTSAKTIPFAFVTGIAACDMWTAFADNTTIALSEISPLLTGGYGVGAKYSASGFSMAFDTAGNLYSGNLDNTLTVIANGTITQLAQLSYFPFGIAVDSVRKRIYVSDANDNMIYVYTTAGAPLKTIQ